MSGKDCGRHDRCRPLPYRRFWRTLFVLILIVFFVILFIFLVLHPHKPRFFVQDATVRQLNVGNGLLTSSLAFTVVSYNPNDKIGVLYDSLTAYASYLGQQITADCSLPPYYQDDNDHNVLNPILYGNSVPLAPFVSNHLNYERQNGQLSLNLGIDGRIRWRVGSWTSGPYYLNVNCLVVLGLSNDGVEGQSPPQPGTKCHVQV